jgi:hypothetical protein
MRTGYAFLAALSLSLTQFARANIFYLKDQWVGADFFQGWNWETENDPTHGRVNYVDQAEAISKNLACGAYIFFLSFSLPGPPTPFSVRHSSHLDRLTFYSF